MAGRSPLVSGAASAPLPIIVALAASADTVASLDMNLRMNVLHCCASDERPINWFPMQSEL